MAEIASYTLEVDWGGTGTFSGANDDISADVKNVNTRQGRDRASQLTGRSAPGVLTVELDNQDGKYNSFKSTSPIFGNIIPGREVRLSATYTPPGESQISETLWSGFLANIVPDISRGVRTATLRAVGPLSKIEAARVRVESQSDIATGAAIGLILDAIDWPAGDRDIETGQTVMSRWFVGEADGAGQEGMRALRDVEEAEAGFIRESRDGKIVFEDRHHRLKDDALVSQAIYEDAAGVDIPYSEIQQDDPLAEIYNIVTAQVGRQSVASSAVLWESQEVADSEPPSLAPGQTLTFIAVYPTQLNASNNVGVDVWTTPAAGTDYVLNSEADGSGDVLTGDISVNVVKALTTMEMSFTNNGSVQAHFTTLQARGAALGRRQQSGMKKRFESSITKYGEREYPIPSRFLSRSSDAQDYIDWVGRVYSEPIPVLTITIVANTTPEAMAEALTREVSDRVTVLSDNDTELGINTGFFVEAISHSIVEQGQLHFVTLELSPAGGYAGGWILGTSELGTDTELGF